MIIIIEVLTKKAFLFIINNLYIYTTNINLRIK